MKCKLPDCTSDVTELPGRGRPPKYCDAHKNHLHERGVIPTACPCGDPIDRPRLGGGVARLCLRCLRNRKAIRNRDNVRRWVAANPAKVRLQQRRAYLKKRALLLPQVSICVDCGEPCNRGPGAKRCRPCWRRNSKLHGKYGIRLADYSRMLVEQDGRCAICRGEPNGHGDLHVDHDHITGRIRGLLCANCNLGLGNLKDDPAVLRAAVDYLTR